ncbi:LacI family DNA-binding transcriptional regulator [Deinococcus pimensis]|uniref:LacI family DNA-binding transcriptional regulator n=1 Tax=Deinococcus pimensis TaxID=309888 RepID=UPI0004824561|nr:LacI family DNA-binding transcriptional regulator [Deinococcus pimensis]
MATINDVARLAGVSPTTAKRALREPELLHPDTLKKVQDAVRTLHYEPDQRAGALRGGQSRTVGLIVASIVEPFFAELARCIGRTLHAAGYSLILSENEYSSERDLDELKLMYGQRVSAMIVRPGYGEKSRDHLLRLRERGVYIVEVDYHLPDAPFDYITLDHRGSIRMAVNYLRDLGHTRIAALGTYHPLIHPELRSRTFPEAMHALGLTVPETYQRVMLLNEDTAYDLTRHLMTLPTPPTALLALNGTQAAGAYRALRELGLRPPQDVSLLTVDNYSWTALVDPPISVIEQPVERMGTEAARLVIRALEEGPGDQPTQLELPGRLIRRGSCAAPTTRSISTL